MHNHIQSSQKKTKTIKGPLNLQALLLKNGVSMNQTLNDEILSK